MCAFVIIKRPLRRRRLIQHTHTFCELIKITLLLLFKQQTTKRPSLMRLAVENLMDIPKASNKNNKLICVQYTHV